MKRFDPTKLKDLRRSRGLKLREVAEKGGFSIPQLSNWENGHSMPPADSLIKVLDIYEANIFDVQKITVTV